MTTALLAGLVTGWSLIVAIGAQNAFVLRQGVARSHVGTVVAICAGSDAVLILAGVAGVGTLVDRAPGAVEAVRWFGVAFLVAYAALSVRRALRPESLATGGQVEESRRAVLTRAVVLTWLNPHVYLDTVLLLGAIAATHDVDVAGGRWWFAAGAVAASISWFTALAWGARRLAPVLSRPRAWLVLELVVAATMLAVAVRLALG